MKHESALSVRGRSVARRADKIRETCALGAVRTQVALVGAVGRVLERARAATTTLAREEEGQGTTEYAILVGILVVIAIAAIVLFRGRIQSLWDSIAGAINGL